MLIQIGTPEGVFRRSDNGWIRLESEEEIAAHRSRGLQSSEKRLMNLEITLKVIMISDHSSSHVQYNVNWQDLVH